MYQTPPEDPQTSRPGFLVWLRDFSFLLLLLSIPFSAVLLVATGPPWMPGPPFDWLPLLVGLICALVIARLCAPEARGRQNRGAALDLCVRPGAFAACAGV
jgi:hypothetical protein